MASAKKLFSTRPKISRKNPLPRDGKEGDSQLILKSDKNYSDSLYIKLNNKWKTIGLEDAIATRKERVIPNVGTIESKKGINAKLYQSINFYLQRDLGTFAVALLPEGGANTKLTVFPCDVKLYSLYYIANDWNPNDSSNIQTWKIYKYRPDGSTNTGDMDTIASWTKIQEVVLTNSKLQAGKRGIFITLNPNLCVFRAGDCLQITIQNSVDVTDNAADEMQVSLLAEFNWNKKILKNI